MILIPCSCLESVESATPLYSCVKAIHLQQDEPVHQPAHTDEKIKETCSDLEKYSCDR